MDVHVIAAQNGYDVELCRECAGAGSRVVKDQVVVGWHPEVCETCGGSGRIWLSRRVGETPLSDAALLQKYRGR